MSFLRTSTPVLSRTLRSLSQRRTMASTVGKFEWLVILPDNEGALAKRLEVRPTHFANLKENVDNGFFQMGGAILEEVPKEGENLKFQGSALIALASSKEEVLEKLKEDVYVKNGVWDLSKMQIYPFKCAIRQPLA